MSRRFALWLVPPLAVGAAARLWGLRDQLLIGDELHTVVSVLEWDLAGILTTFRRADPCIPLAALFRILSDLGVPLTETLLRAPAVAAGLAAIALLPCLARRELPARHWRTSIVFAWLLALSPLLVYYGRIARPYAVVVLLGGSALAFGWRFLEGRGRRWGAAYALSAALAIWFHLLSAPFVLVPLAFAAAEALLARRTGRPRLGAPRAIEIAGVAAGLVAVVGVFMMPGAESFLRLWNVKQAGSSPDLSTLSDVAVLQAGVVVPWVAPLFWLLAAVGLASLVRARPRLTTFALTALATQWVAVAVVLRPAGAHLPLVLDRYVLITYPLVLFAVAHGIAVLFRVGSAAWRDRRAARGGAPWRLVAPAGAIGILVALLACHPYLRDPALRFGPFAASNPAVAFTTAPPTLPPGALPEIYRLLAAESDGAALVEAPVGLASHQLSHAQALWRFHGRPVSLAGARHWLLDANAERRLAFRHLIPARPRAIEASGARWVVVDAAGPETDGAASSAPVAPPLPRVVAAAAGEDSMAEPLVTSLRASWGEPHLQGDGLVAWDLDRVRSRPRQARALRR